MIALNRRYSYEDIFQGMEELSRRYPDFTVCGPSVQATTAGIFP